MSFNPTAIVFSSGDLTIDGTNVGWYQSATYTAESEIIEHITHPTDGEAAYVRKRSQARRGAKLTVTGIIITGGIAPFLEGETAEDLAEHAVSLLTDGEATVAMGTVNIIPTGRITQQQSEWVVSECEFRTVGSGKPTLSFGAAQGA